MGLNWCCAFSGFVAPLRNTGLGEPTAFLANGELVGLGRVTYFLKVVHCKHNPEKWPEQWAVWALHSWPTQQECAGTFGASGGLPHLPPCPSAQMTRALRTALTSATTIADAEVKPSGALSATSVFSLAESKVKPAQAFQRISVNRRPCWASSFASGGRVGDKVFPKGLATTLCKFAMSVGPGHPCPQIHFNLTSKWALSL